MFRWLKRVRRYITILRSIFRIHIGLLIGMWKLTKLDPPVITFFGGSRLSIDDRHAQLICQLARKLAHHGFSILTGGGPGIMEAANLGAYEERNHNNNHSPVSIGIGLARLNQQVNRYVQSYIIQPYFFTRKWLLVRSAVGFVVGPGGFGTLDELSEVLTLIQTHHMPSTPVILIGIEYWTPLMAWIQESALKNHLLLEQDAKIITLTDDINEAFHILSARCAPGRPTGSEAAPK